jgi:hypothetical protein
MTAKVTMPAARLCIFCEHFSWSAEEMWGMGGEYTGPMFEGGDASCAKKHFGSTYPKTDAEYREVILHGTECPDFAQVELGE